MVFASSGVRRWIAPSHHHHHHHHHHVHHALSAASSRLLAQPSRRGQQPLCLILLIAFQAQSPRHGKVFAMTDLDDLRYPVGRFRPPAASTPGIRAAQIETLRQLPERLRAAVARPQRCPARHALSRRRLDRAPGRASLRRQPRQLLIRFKLALTEDWPTIKPYDEAAWARLPDSLLPIDGSLVFIDALHARWVALLESMSEEDFRTRLQPSRSGPQDLATILGASTSGTRAITPPTSQACAHRMGW